MCHFLSRLYTLRYTRYSDVIDRIVHYSTQSRVSLANVRALLKTKDDIASNAKKSAWIQCKYRFSIDRDFRYKYNKLFKTKLGWDIKPIWWSMRMGLQYQKQSHDTWHNDVIKWNHFTRYWPFVRGIHRSPVTSPHKGQWRGTLMFSLICAWIID